MFKKFLMAALGLVMFSASAQAATTLNLVFLSTIDTAEHEGAKYLKHYVEARTNGELLIDIYPGAQLCGNAPECFQALDSETVHLYPATAGGISIIYPEIAALNLPYIVESDALVQEMMSGIFENHLREIILKNTNDKFLVMNLTNPAGWRAYANAIKEIKSPDDVRGLKLRTVEDQVQMEQVRLHSASPTPIPMMEVYDSLSKGVVDGTLNSITDIIASKLYEKAKFLTLDGHNFLFSAWFMKGDFFKSLPLDQQMALLDGFKLAGNVENGVQMSQEIPAYDLFRNAGGKLYILTAEEKAVFMAEVAPLREWYLKTFGEKGEEFLTMLDASLVEAQSVIDERYNSFDAFLNR